MQNGWADAFFCVVFGHFTTVSVFLSQFLRCFKQIKVHRIRQICSFLGVNYWFRRLFDHCKHLCNSDLVLPWTFSDFSGIYILRIWYCSQPIPTQAWVSSQPTPQAGTHPPLRATGALGRPTRTGGAVHCPEAQILSIYIHILLSGGCDAGSLFRSYNGAPLVFAFNLWKWSINETE